MGTFIGHAVPASIFVAMGLWWTVNIFKHFFASKRKGGLPFQSQPWYPGPFGTKFPMESAFKIAISATASSMELVAILQTVPIHFGMKYAVHITMFLCFGLNGAMDLLKYKGFPLPDGIEVASGLLALGVEGFLISNHVHDGRFTLDVHLHFLLVYIVIAIVLSIFLEIGYRDCVIPSLARAFFTLLHGTWILQLSFILYPPFPGMQEWDMMDHEKVMLASLIFTWHLVAIFVFMLLIGAGVWRWIQHDRQSYNVKYELVSQEATSDEINGANSPQKPLVFS